MSDLTQTRATLAPTATITGYLRKRRTSEGENRRRFSRVSGEDIDLDAENALFWGDVIAACLLQIGETVESARSVRYRTPIGGRVSAARGAAFRVCHDAGIPLARLAEFAGIAPSSVRAWILREDRPDVDAIAARCVAALDPSEAKTIYVEVTKEAAHALARAAESSGASELAVASAALIAAARVA